MVRALVPLALILSLGISRAETDRVVHRIDFTAQPAGSATGWLQEHGFKFELDAEELHQRFENGALHLSTAEPARGLLNYSFVNGKELHGVKKVRITWGVRQFPEGADWERGINRLAIGVMISFGNERLSSGLPLGVSPAPYFVCPFLGNKEPAGKVYIGQYWKLGGRYISCKPGKAGEPVTTLIEVDDLFQNLFKKKPTPPITALGIQLNSTDTEGKAGAFVSRIEFLN